MRLYHTSRPHHSVLPRHTGTDADRLHKYGKIVPMDRPEGEPPAWLGISLLIVLALCLTAAVVMIGGGQ